ncbi:MAG: hypothetical protein ACOC1F_01505 [Myxococcota bacterium]
MKTDVLIVPNDTLVIGQGRRPVGRHGLTIDARFPTDLFMGMVRAAYASQGLDAPSGMRIMTQLFATGVGDRLEPLYPVPDDLVVEPGAKDAVWAQPAYLETINPELVEHDMGELRLLIPSSRNLQAHPFAAFLTRKGVRVWADRKPQRLTEGEHYMPFSRLFEVEVRPSGQGASFHLSLKPGTGFLITLEIPDGSPELSLPVTVAAGAGGRTVRLEKAQFPQPTIESKSRKRWRLCLLSNVHVAKGGWPPWVDAQNLSTREPLPEGGKVVAVARRRGENVAGAPFSGASGQAQTVIPVGTTVYIEFEEPVRIEQSAEILAGGS